ncbi:MAG: GGDEF domain-containing protein [Gammaproteobacteria bacterium]|nr:GGDEF domain-containing protein [Gammaproteobacteria bacterium]
MALSTSQLTQLVLFKDVNPDTVRHLTAQCPIKDFSIGEVLLSPGEENHSMYVVLEGSASIRLNSLDNSPIAEVGKGESIGEMSALDKGITPSAFVRAEQPMKAMVISHTILMQLIDQSHELARNLLFQLSNRVRSVNITVTNSQQLQKQSELNANIDSLTGLYNRRWIDSYFDRLLCRKEQRKDQPDFAVLIADVDHFKKFNDTFGHLAGDQALRCVATALRENTRPTDIVARYGGEEFLILLPDTCPDVAVLIANRIIKGMREQPIKMGDTVYPNITISAGIASLRADDSFESLVLAADKGLFRAKNNGRNQAAIERV